MGPRRGPVITWERSLNLGVGDFIDLPKLK